MKIYLLFILLGLTYSQYIRNIPLNGKVTGNGNDYYYLDTISLKDNTKVYIEIVYYDYFSKHIELFYKKSSTNYKADFEDGGMISVPLDYKTWKYETYYLWSYDYKYTYTYKAVYTDGARRYLLFKTDKSASFEITLYHRSSSYYWIMGIVAGVVVFAIIIFAILYARRRRALLNDDTTIIVQPGYQEPIQPTYPAYGTPAYI